jgi:hypothetical protein
VVALRVPDGTEGGAGRVFGAAMSGAGGARGAAGGERKLSVGGPRVRSVPVPESWLRVKVVSPTVAPAMLTL